MGLDRNVYEFSRFQLNSSEHVLLRDGVPIPLTVKAFETLLVLVQGAGHLVEKSELIKTVWEGSFVEQGNLTVTIWALRKALGDDRKERRYIETVAKLGYRFVADVRKVEPREAVSAVAPAAIESSTAESRLQSKAFFEDPARRGRPVMVAVGIGIIISASFLTVRLFANGRDLKSALARQSSLSFQRQIAQTGVDERDRSQDPQAYQSYLEGRYQFSKGTKDGLRRSIEDFQRATLADPKYADAYAGLANSYAMFASYGMTASQEAYPVAKAAALKAIQLNNALAEAHTSLALVLFQYEWDWPNAGAEFQKAIKLDPNDTMARISYAKCLAAQGRFDQALEQAQRAQELEPLSAAVATTVGRIYYLGRHYDLSVSALRRAMELDPYFQEAHAQLGMVYAATGDYSGAILEFQQASRLSGTATYLDGLSGYVEAREGHTGTARGMMTKLMERSQHEYIPAFNIAMICVGLGARDQALEWLEKSYQDRSHFLIYAKVDPLLDLERSDPRFANLLARMALTGPEAQSASIPTTNLAENPLSLPSQSHLASLAPSRGN